MTQSANQPVKFLFETSFDCDVTPAIGEDELAALQAKAYQQGFNAAQEETATHIGNALEAIAQKFESFSLTLNDEKQKIKNQAAKLALITARKLANNLIARQPLAEIESLINEALGHMPQNTRLLIEVNDSVLKDIQDILSKAQTAQFFQGELMLQGVDDIAISDCRIAWGNGEIIRNTPALERQIDAILANYLPPEDALAGAKPESKQERPREPGEPEGDHALSGKGEF